MEAFYSHTRGESFDKSSLPLFLQRKFSRASVREKTKMLWNLLKPQKCFRFWNESPENKRSAKVETGSERY